MSIRVSPFFLLLLTAFLLIDGTGYALLLLTAALLHEAGHITALRLCGVGLRGIRLGAFGIELATGDMKYLPYRSELAVAAAGPAANLAAMLLTIAAVAALGPFEGALFFTVCNAALAAVNLMPVTGLDGGRMLSSILLPRMGLESGEKLLDTVSALCSGIVAASGLWLLWVTQFNFSLALIGAYLIARRAFGPGAYPD